MSLMMLFCIGIFVLFSINKIYGFGENQFSYTSYKHMISDLQDGKLSGEILAQGIDDANGLNPHYTKTGNSEEALYRSVYGEWYQVNDYSNWLNKILNPEIQFMGTQNNYQKRSMEVQKKKFVDLKGLKVSFQGNRGIEVIQSLELYDVLLPLLMLLLALGLISVEREKNIGVLLYPTVGGQRKLAVAKYTTGIMSAVGLGFMIVLVKLILTGMTYGFADLGAPVQSVCGYQDCPYKISIGYFLIIYVLLYLLVSVMFFSVFYFIVLSVSNRMLALIVSIGALGLFWIFAYKISIGSEWEWLRLYNLWTFLDVGKIFGKWQTQNIFGYPVSYFSIFLCINVFIIGVVTWYSITCFNRSELLTEEDVRRDGFLHLHGMPGGSFVGECYKCLICRGGGRILVMLLVVLFLFSPAYYDCLDSLDKVYYKNYIKQVEGSCSEQKSQILQKEKQKIQQSMEKLQTGNLTSEAYYILSRYILREKALNQVLKQEKYLKKQKKGCFLYEKGYETYIDTGKVSWINLLFHGTGILIMSLLGVMIWRVEQETGMEQLICSSVSGKKGVECRKRLLIALVSLIVCICVYGYMLFKIHQEYDLSQWKQSIQNIRSFSWIPVRIPIWFIFLIAGIIRWIYLCMVGMISSVIAASQKEYQSAVVLNFLIGMLPVAGYFLLVI